MHWLGTALVEIYETDESQRIKTDLLDQVVSIVRRNDKRDERAEEIAALMRNWQQMRGD